MELGLKWVHMGRYEVILRLDGALWLTIIFNPLLTPKRAITIQFESYFGMFVTENVSMLWNVSMLRFDSEHLRFEWTLSLLFAAAAAVKASDLKSTHASVGK